MAFKTKDGSTVYDSWIEAGIDVPATARGLYKTTCPACSHTRKNKKDPCLSVNIDDQVALCHHCNEKFIIDKKGYQTVNIEKQYKLPEQKSSYTECGASVIDWFNGRGISVETLRQLKVTSGEEFMPQVGAKVNTIQFNYFDRDVLTNTKYRDKDKNFRMVRDAKLIFYNLNVLYQAGDYVVITEGEIDAMSYIEADVSRVISVPNGASKGSMNLDYLTNHYHLFDDDQRAKMKLSPLKRIIISTDDDDAGHALKKELIRRLGAHRCWTIDLKGHNDPNELLLKEGKVALKTAFDNAIPAPLDDVKTVHDMRAELAELQRTGLVPGAQVGSDTFQELMSFEQPRMTIVTGISTHGKSEFLDDVISRLSVFHGWKFGVFSPENFPIEYHISKLVSKITGKEFGKVSGVELEQVYQFIAEHFFWIYPDNDDYTLENILKINDQLVARYGINGLIIDPWTEVDKLGKTGTEDINEWLSIMNRYKRNKNVHMFLVAHPTKMGKDEKGKVIVPDLMNISGSGHFYNKTDAGITVYRDFEEQTVRIYVNKIKFKHLGRIGYVTMSYNNKNGRYQDRNDVEIHGWDDSNWLNIETQTEIKIPVAPREEEDPIEKMQGGIMPADPDLPF